MCNSTPPEFPDERTELEGRIAHNQKKLIPLNIVVVLLCLTAALSLLLAPLLTIDIGAASESIMDLIDDELDDSSSGSSDSSSEYIGMVMDTLSDLKLSFTTLGIAQFAFSEDPVETLKESVINTVAESAERVAVTVTVNMMLDEFSEELEDVDTDKIDADKLYDKIDALSAATPQTRDSIINEFTDELRSQLGADVINDDLKGNINDMVADLYDKTVEHNNNDFTVQALICVTVSELLADEGTPENEITYYTNYSDLFEKLLNDQESSSGSSGSAADDLNDTLETMAEYLQYFCYAMFFFMGIWVILALFAGLRLLCKNKRFVTWYVKLFGFFPCLIFGVAPLVAGSLIESFIGGTEGATIAGVIGAISSLTWISGACYLALWLISIFWAFPIKHKIRKDKRALKDLA